MNGRAFGCLSPGDVVEVQTYRGGDGLQHRDGTPLAAGFDLGEVRPGDLGSNTFRLISVKREIRIEINRLLIMIFTVYTP